MYFFLLLHFIVRTFFSFYQILRVWEVMEPARNDVAIHIRSTDKAGRVLDVSIFTHTRGITEIPPRVDL